MRASASGNTCGTVVNTYQLVTGGINITELIAPSTQQVTNSIAGVSQGAAGTGAAAEQVLSAAGELSRQAESLSAEVGGFVSAVRAA